MGGRGFLCVCVVVFWCSFRGDGSAQQEHLLSKAMQVCLSVVS